MAMIFEQMVVSLFQATDKLEKECKDNPEIRDAIVIINNVALHLRERTLDLEDDLK